MTKEQIIKEVFKELASTRLFEEEDASATFEKARKNAEFAASDDELRALNISIAKNAAFGRETAELEKQREKAINRRNTALQNIGLTDNDFLPRRHCKLCNDTGVIGGEQCSCFKKLYLKKLRDACDITFKANFRFKDCDFSVFKNPDHKKKMQMLYKTMRGYCEKFPDVKYRNILLMGGTGVGKTCLAGAMTNELLERGYSVVFLSAFDFNKLMLRYHTSPISVRDIYIEDILSCDFLVLDDLGTEQIIRNVTEEYLFLVMSTRDNAGKHTMFNTNLTPDELLRFYGERIFSRITNKRTTICRYVDGDDLRLSN